MGGSFLQMFCCVIFLIFFANQAHSVCTRDSYATLPSAAVFPTDTLASSLVPSGRPVTKNHWSEVAKYSNYRPAPFTPVANPSQTNCPHLQANLKDWHTASTWPGNVVPANGAAVTIPANTNVLVSSCSILSTDVFGTITIPFNSSLIFGDAAITFSAKGFDVRGSLLIGSPTCRLRNKIKITLYGSRGAQALPAASPVKGIATVGGLIDIHGMQYTKTWSRLAMTAEIGDQYIFIQDMVNWQPGQSIFITSTELKDARDWHRNEVRQVVKVFKTSIDATVSAIQLDSPLSYQHYGGAEYQAEVGLLSRNIVVQGDPNNSEPTDIANPICRDAWNSTYPCPDKYLTGFGGHIQVIGTGARGRFSGVELFRMGQTNVLGRYPFHWHMVGNTTTTNNYATDCSVHNSFFRCYTIHGTNGVRLEENTAYDAIGNCFYLSENGVEEESVIRYNLGAHVHALGNLQDPSTLNQFYGQTLSYYNASPTLLVPADISAAPFYATNMYNTIEGNAASGGWTGFSFPNLPTPIDNFKTVTNLVPRNRPFRTPFRGNTAHSSGFWWGSAAAFYFGGLLKYTNASQTLLTYTAGRDVSTTHDSCTDPTLTGCYDLAKQLWLQLEDNKAFLSNRGLQSWGNRADIVRFEIHDAVLSMNVFGKVWVNNLLMNCRSNHLPTWYSGCPATPPISQRPRYGLCNVRDYYFNTLVQGFQWYDVGQTHIVTDTTFRNCRSDWQRCIFGPSTGICGSSAVFTSLSHSDQFVPQVMQATSGLSLQNCNQTWRTSTSLTSPMGRTVSGMMQSWLDVDGSASGVGSRAMIGSGWANEWWKMNSNCYLKDERWVCPMQPLDSSAAFKLVYNATVVAQVGTTICVNGNSDGTKPCPTVGQATHFGRSESLGVPVSAMGQLTGPIIYKAGGWFLRYTLGTPKVLTIKEIQVSPSDVLLIALPYPANTVFNITFEGASWCGTSWATCTHPFAKVSSVQQVVSGFGDVYYWDNTKQTLYLRLIIQNATFTKPDAPWTVIPPAPAQFTRHGITIPPVNGGPTVVIRANCATDPCAPQPQVVVPAEVNSWYTGVTTTKATTAATTTTKATTAATTTTKATTTPAPTTKATTTAATTTKATTAATTTTKATTTPATTTKATTTVATTTKATTTPATTTKATTAATTTTKATTTPAPTTKATTTVATTTKATTTTTKATTTPLATTTTKATTAATTTTKATTTAPATTTKATTTTTKATTTTTKATTAAPVG